MESDLATFESNMAVYRQGLASTSGADLRAVEYLDYSEQDTVAASRRLLSRVPVGIFRFYESAAPFGLSLGSRTSTSSAPASSSARVVFLFRLSVARYFVATAQQGLDELSGWVLEQNLPAVTVLELVLTCGAGAEPTNIEGADLNVAGAYSETGASAFETSALTATPAPMNVSSNMSNSTTPSPVVSNASNASPDPYSLVANVSCVLCAYGKVCIASCVLSLLDVGARHRCMVGCSSGKANFITSGRLKDAPLLLHLS